MSNTVQREVRWEKLRRDEIAAMAQREPVLLLPIGAIEQHGPHLPVDTDSNSAAEFCERTARLLDDGTALVLPPIVWGLSPYWLPFAGTISLRPETTLALIGDIGRSVAIHGFRRLIIVNGHGGNGGLIGVAATQLAEHGIRAMALSYWSLLGADLHELTPGDHGHIGHAGQSETSIQLYLQPDRVDPDFARISHWTDLAEMAPNLLTTGAYTPPLPLVEAPSGIYGDVTKADGAIGAELIDRVVKRLARVVRDFPSSMPA